MPALVGSYPRLSAHARACRLVPARRYTIENVEKRLNIRKHPKVYRWLNIWWDNAMAEVLLQTVLTHTHIHTHCLKR